MRFYDNCTCYTQECSIGTMTIGPSIQRLLIRYSLTQKREYAYPLSHQRPNHFPKSDKPVLCYSLYFFLQLRWLVYCIVCFMNNMIVVFERRELWVVCINSVITVEPRLMYTSIIRTQFSIPKTTKVIQLLPL